VSMDVGDHVATAYLPACGVCTWCAQGMQYICDTGAGMENGFALDGSARAS
jgi:Zn-dependent alcohol dehydrogenase